jgi:hypothetical protein
MMLKGEVGVMSTGRGPGPTPLSRSNAQSGSSGVSRRRNMAVAGHWTLRRATPASMKTQAASVSAAIAAI